MQINVEIFFFFRKGKDWSVLKKISLARLLLLFRLDEENSGMSVFQKLEEQKQIPYSLSKRSIIGSYKYLKNHRDTFEVLVLDILNEKEEDSDNEQEEDSDKENTLDNNNEKEDDSINEKGEDTWVLNPYNQAKEDSIQLLENIKEEENKNEESGADGVGQEENIENEEELGVESEEIIYGD